jgi:hypothetical protein
MNRVSNKDFSLFKVRSTFDEYKEPPIEEDEEAEEEIKFEDKPRKYLPGQLLLKKLDKKRKTKHNPLDMKILEASISSILNKF